MFNNFHRGRIGHYLIGGGSIFLFCLLLLIFLSCQIEENKLLLIEDQRTGEVLWQSHISIGDRIVYENNHSVYKDRVYQTYRVTSDWHFNLVKVISSDMVLYSGYPGFGFPETIGKKSGDVIEIDLLEINENKLMETLVIAVGTVLTDNRMTVGEKVVDFDDLVGGGGVVKIYIADEISQ